MLAFSDTTDHAEHFGIWHFLQKEKIWFSKVLASPGTLKNDHMGAENDQNFAYFRYFPLKILFLLEIIYIH